jgi:thymidylate synthase
VDNDMGLSCHVTIRSNDLLLGNPFNVVSYAVFTYIIAKQVDMKPKDLIISIADAHEYLNHEEAIKIQLSRSPLPFPVLGVNDSVKNKKIEEIEVEDFELIGYIYHPAIKAPMAI